MGVLTSDDPQSAELIDFLGGIVEALFTEGDEHKARGRPDLALWAWEARGRVEDVLLEATDRGEA